VRRRERAVALSLTLVAVGCGDEPQSFAPSNVHASVNASIATVVNVQWTTAEPSIGYVSYGTTPNLGTNTAIESVATTSHSASIVGASPSTTYYYRVATWQHLDTGASPVATVTTGAAPSDLPVFTVSGDSASDNGFKDLLLLPVIAQRPIITVVAPTGRVLWYHAEDKGRSVTRARFSSDGKAVLYNAIGNGTTTTSEIVRVPLDGSSVTSLAVPNLGKDFVQLANGNYAALVSDVRASGTNPMLRGDKLVEIDANGNATTIVSLWDCFDPATYPGDGANGDWTGAAAMGFLDNDDKDPSNDVFYLSVRNLSTVVRVLRSTGKCDRAIGAAAPAINFAAGSSPFLHPGGVFANDSTLLVFDADGAGTGTSRGIEYTLDLTALTATQTWQYQPTPALHVDTPAGSVSSLTNNRRLVNWSTAGKLEVASFTPGTGSSSTKDVVWSMQVPAGTTFGYHVRTTSLDQPVNKP
jgi:hypothetical protein